MTFVAKIRSYIIFTYRWIINTKIAPMYMIHKGVKMDIGTARFNGIPFVSKSPTGKIVIGSNALINSSERSNPLAVDHPTSFLTYKDSRIQIGDNCSFSGTIIVAHNSIKIGDNTMIGANSKIYDTDFHPMDYKMRESHPTKHAKTRPIIIGSNVFIGCHVHILKGVTIHDNAVVPAGTFVRRDFPEISENERPKN